MQPTPKSAIQHATCACAVCSLAKLLSISPRLNKRPTGRPPSPGWRGSVATAFESSAQERQPGIKKTPTKIADLDISELKRVQLGKGVRGKYLQPFVHGSNVVVLQPKILKAFPTPEAVNKALASMLAFAHETQVLSVQTQTTPRKRLAAKTAMVSARPL